MYDVILFTDLTNNRVMVKPIGAYKIARTLRLQGYKVKVINDLLWILQNRYDELLGYLDSIVDGDTVMFGFSTTFLSAIEFGGGMMIEKNKSTSWNKKPKRPWDYDKEELEEDFTIKPEFARFLKDLRRYRHVKRVMGGDSGTSYILWNMCQDLDYWIQGLAETSVVQFMKKHEEIPPGIFKYDRYAALHDFHNSTIVFEPEDNIIENETLPFEISRGCRFKCKFCSYPLLGRSPKDDQYIKSPDAILAEMQHNRDHFGTRNYSFLCDTFNESQSKMVNVKDAISKLKLDIRFFSYLRIDLLHKNPDQIPMLRDMGIAGAHFGIESFNHASAKAVGKGLHPDKTLETLAKCKEVWRNDTIVHSGFIIGLPHDTPETVSDWCGILERNETPLDSWSLQALNINMNPREELSHMSEFDINAEKYGYDRTGPYWKNEHWDYPTTVEWTREFYKNVTGHTARSPTPHTALSYLSLDFSWHEIFHSNRNFGVFMKEMNLRAEEKRLEYFEELIES